MAGVAQRLLASLMSIELYLLADAIEGEQADIDTGRARHLVEQWNLLFERVDAAATHCRCEVCVVCEHGVVEKKCLECEAIAQ